jgi:hypothetical protein
MLLYIRTLFAAEGTRTGALPLLGLEVNSSKSSLPRKWRHGLDKVMMGIMMEILTAYA